MADEGLRIVNTVDNSQMERELKKSRETIMSVAEAAEEAGARIDAAFQKLSQPKAAVDYKEIVESAKRAVEEIRKVFDEDIDLSNPSQELQKFDEQVVGLCEHLDNYFESLKAKLTDLLGVMGSGQSMTNNIPTNENNISQIESIKRQNEELEEQIRKQTEELARQQAQWKQLAEAVRTNNVAAVQKLSQETDEATKRIKLDALKGSLKMLGGEMDDFAEKMANADAEVESLRDELAMLREQGAGEDKIAETEELYQSAVDKLEELKTEYNAMSEQQQQYIDQLKEADDHHVRMRTQIMDAREQLIQMIQAGQTGTPQFQQLAKQAGSMRKEMALANAYMQYFGTPNSHLAALKQGLQGVAGAASLVTGVMGIFNDKSEKMQEIQTKVQSILGIIIGLETTYATVKKTSNVMIAIQELQVWALSKAKKAEAASTTMATIAQAAYNAVAKANPYVLLATAIISVVGALALLIKGNRDAAKEEEKRQKQLEETREKEEELRREREQHANLIGGKYASTHSNLMATYKKLQLEYENLKTTHEKNEWIKDNVKEFEKLGVSVKTVHEAESVLIDDTDVMVQAFQYRAQAAAAAAEAMEAYTEAARLEFEKQDHMKQVGSQWHENDIYHGDVSRYGLQEGRDFQWSDKGGAQLTAAGAERANREAARLSAEFMQFDERIAELNRQGERWTQKQVEAEQKIQEILKKAEILSANNSNGNNGNGNPNDPNQIIRAQMLANQKAERERRNNLLLEEQATIDIMADGAEKELAQMRLNHKKKMAQIDDEQQEILNAKRDIAAASSTNYYTSGAYKNETLSDLEMLGVDSKRISENED